MFSVSVGQLILDAQRMANRAKDLDNLSGAVLVEAEGNNRIVESLRQFQEDIDVLNRLSNNKTNAEIVNRIQQQNANSSEIIKENRELKLCLEDYEKTLEVIMKKYREHSTAKVLDAKINFNEIYNEGLWRIIREQRDKINEMACVMKHAATIDEDSITREMENISRLQLENKTLRELLNISKQFGSANVPIRSNDHLLIEKGVQTDLEEFGDNSCFLDTSKNNNTILEKTFISASLDNSGITPSSGEMGENNNGPNISTLNPESQLDISTVNQQSSDTISSSLSELSSPNSNTTPLTET